MTLLLPNPIRAAGKSLLGRHPLLDGLFRRFVWSRFHFPEMEMRFLHELPKRSIDVAVDVGAALGSYAWVLSRVSQKVIAFEPGRSHSEYLGRLVFGTNIEVVRAAVGSFQGHVRLYTPGTDSHARHSATLSTDNPVSKADGVRVDDVEQVALDEFLGKRLSAGQRLELLKVDVEGYELEVFKGCVGRLSSDHPLIICEIEARHNSNYGEVFALLKGLGYECFIFSGGFQRLNQYRIEGLQRGTDLEVRMSKKHNPKLNRYINNFVFEHPDSRVRLRK